MVQLESVGCYLCHARDASPWGAEAGFHMVKCGRCGLVYLDPRPDAREIDEAARTGLHRLAAGAVNAIGRYSAKRAASYRTKLEPLIGQMGDRRAPWRWLDIGAGFGELVEALQQLHVDGAGIRGIEPCEPKVRTARSRGLPVTAQPLSQVEGPFTHVSLINVYSHLPDPVQFLADLQRLMEPEAYLLLVTGNGGDVPRSEFPGSLYLPDHLSFAGEANLRTALDAARYDIVSITPYPETVTLDGRLVTAAKNIARRLTGRAPVPVSVSPQSRFRSLWIVARRRA